VKRFDVLLALGLATLAVASIAIPLHAGRSAAESRGGQWTGLDPTRDVAQYACFVARASHGDGPLFANPYDPDSDRTILALGLAAAGWLAGLTGLGVSAAVGAVHFTAVALVPFALLRMLAGLGLGGATRRTAAVAVVLAGGTAFFVARLAAGDPSIAAWRTDIYPSYGWSTLAALANPLWALALLFGFLAVDALVRAEESPTRTRRLWLGACAVLLYPTHFFLGGGGLVLLLVLAVASRARAKLLLALLPAVGFALVHVAIALGGSALGSGRGRALRPIVFSPLEALGALGLLIPLGLAGLLILRRSRDEGPARRVLGLWLLVAAALSWNPFLAGVKFVTLMHPPLAVLSAVALVRLVRGGGARRIVAVTAAVICLTAAPQMVRIRAADAESLPYARLEPGETAVLSALADAPAGPVLSVETVGVRLPWLGGRTPWLGHWFLTPDFRDRRDAVRGLFTATDDTEKADAAARYCRDHGIAVVLWREGDEAFFGACPPASWPRFLVVERCSLVLVPSE